jgi:ribonuclease HI
MFRMVVGSSREEAIKMDEEDAAAIQIYTDGSGKDRKVGAAAVLYRNGKKKSSLKYLLGLDKDHTVPEAEGVGWILGLELIRKEGKVGRTSMAVDNVGMIIGSTSVEMAPA